MTLHVTYIPHTISYFFERRPSLISLLKSKCFGIDKRHIENNKNTENCSNIEVVYVNYKTLLTGTRTRQPKPRHRDRLSKCKECHLAREKVDEGPKKNESKGDEKTKKITTYFHNCKQI